MYPETYQVQDHQEEKHTYQEIRVEDQSTAMEPDQDEHEQEHGPEIHTNQDMAEQVPHHDHHTDRPTDPKDRTKDALHHQQATDQIEAHQEEHTHTL